MAEYPRKGTTQKKSRNTQAKCACGAIGKAKVDVQFNCMRGDDEVYWACPEHIKDWEYLVANAK